MRKKIAVLLSTVMFMGCVAGAFGGNVLRISAQTAQVQEDGLHMEKLIDMTQLEGYAQVKGEGLETITGGNMGEVVVVENTVEFVNAVKDDLPRVVVVSGEVVSMLSNDKMDIEAAKNLENNSTVKSAGGWGLSVGSNKTIVGIDENAVIYGGLKINGKSNVIVSNLTIHGVWPYSGPGDTLEVAGSHHVWLNHLNVCNSQDGNLDIKLGSDYITVSWCRFYYENLVCEWDTTTKTGSTTVSYKKGNMTDVVNDHGHRLSGLVGSGAGDHDDTDMGKLHVTFHHNWFADGLDQRMPRVMYGRTHVYNNYYSCEKNTYCIGVDSYASVLVENNYFKNVNNPHEFSLGNGFPASIIARGNEYDNVTGTKAEGQLSSTASVDSFETTVYDYRLNDACDIPEIVQDYAGPQDRSDKTAVPDKLKDAVLIEGKEESAWKPLPSVSPLPTQKPVNTLNDNPVTYDKKTDTYTYNGQNSNKSNAYYTIENPYKNYDFNEKPQRDKDGYPVWTKGATISYWVKMPKGCVDAAILNFNLENDRQMNRNDAAKYNMCKNYSADDASYSLGTQKTFVDAAGNEYRVLAGYGKNVLYNPDYPEEGCYTASEKGGAIYACEKGQDSSAKSNWKYLDFIGEGLYKSYGYRFDEEGGYNSRIAEGYISGSFSLYASGSMGYRQDNWNALQINPYLNSYGQTMDAQQYNQFYYWGNGGYHTLDEDFMTPVMEEKDEWHFVVVVIKNDWVQFYMDGVEMDLDYLEWWGQPINMNTGSKSFNLGYGHAKCYRTKNPGAADATGMTILDFISDEDTVLTVGGIGAGATRLGQEKAGTPNGTQIKNIEFYYEPITKECIKEDRILTEPQPSVSPQPSEKPGDVCLPGDVDDNGKVELKDAQIVLKAALKIMSLDEKRNQAADVDENGNVELRDAQLILKYVLKIIDSFTNT